MVEFVRGLHNIKSYHTGCILAIGNFDGFHRGHQALISSLCEKKNSYKLPIMVMIFEPQPKEYFFKNKITIRLTNLRDKISYLFTAGVDIILCIEFNKKFASIAAYNFIKEILVYKLGVRVVCVGNDFRFGAFRQGDCDFLEKIGKREGFLVIRACDYFDRYGQKISSTGIRTVLLKDRLKDAELLMGHSYCVSGRVIHGDSLGYTIGFPTANISLKGKRLPIHGVYIVEVYGIFNIPLPGVANIGIRPTVSGLEQQQLEIYLLNISLNLYDYHVKVVFLKKIRDEQYFSSINMLQNQIQKDVIKTYDYFKKYYQWNRR